MTTALRKKLLIIKTGTYRDRAPTIAARYGDQEEVFLAAAGHPVKESEIVAVYMGEELKNSPASYSGILITGSGSMLSSPERWMEHTASWLREAVKLNAPVLGVCFGHQMLAYALGGTIGPNPSGLEVGTIGVLFNEAAASDPLFCGSAQRTLYNAHHYETVTTLPDGAQILAANSKDSHQVLRYGPRAWSTQFHPEIDRAIMQELVGVFSDAIERAGEPVDLVRRSIDETPDGPALLKRFIALAAAEPEASV